MECTPDVMTGLSEEVLGYIVLENRIGFGVYSDVYDYGNEVLIVSCDTFKSDMAGGEFPKLDLFPKVKYIGEYKGLDVYIMDKYTVYLDHDSLEVALNPAHWQMYRALWMCPESLPEAIEETDNEAVKDLLRAVMNCDLELTPYLDIAPVNVGVDENGNLKLFDIFYGG